MHKALSTGILLLTSFFTVLWADYPMIGTLRSNNILYVQLQKDIQQYYKAQSRLNPQALPRLAFFRYQVQKSDTLFALAARLNIPYDTIASLNRISHSAEFGTVTDLLIPNMPGIFVPAEPQTALEEIMYSWRSNSTDEPQEITVLTGDKSVTFYFFCGDKFHAIERAYFLKILFRFPLPTVVLTSQFGMRSDPFTGHASFHNGIDLAAPLGTPVYVTREGTVREGGYSEIYGIYVLVAHPGGYETLYGHLAACSVAPGQTLRAGMQLGTVGLTGKTTGPHLHFEIRKDGRAIDPNNLLPSD